MAAFAVTAASMQGCARLCLMGDCNAALPRAVGEFRMLVDAAERDRSLCDNLKRVLKLSKARAPAPPALDTDATLGCHSRPAKRRKQGGGVPCLRLPAVRLCTAS